MFTCCFIPSTLNCIWKACLEYSMYFYLCSELHVLIVTTAIFMLT
uniref:Macaca fascicularis brain cDNA, clone: QmoA-12220 n=1 Tax=Macaca fascicularis TaxID=9541 RepID=I7GKX1_MACFA|nr:unnamed protein product [Macaca fascicularis]